MPGAEGMFLLVILGVRPLFLRRSVDSPREIEYDGGCLTEVVFGSGDFLGFYDWIRDFEGRCLGVRFILHKASTSARETLPRTDYIHWEADDIVLIRFAEGSEDPEMSVDQEFSIARVYCGVTGLSALLIDASNLDESDFRRLVTHQGN